MIEGAQAGAAVHASVGHSTIAKGKIHRASVQAGLRLVVGVIMEYAV